MPWMPEVFTSPIAEDRRAEDAMPANDAIAYYEGIMAEEADALAHSFATQQPVVDDPRLGRVEGAEAFTAFVADQVARLRKRDAVVENVALTRTPTRTVEEVVLHMLADNGGQVDLPVAVVADSNPDRTLNSIRVYHSMWPLTGEHTIRPPLLPADPELHAEGAVGDYQRALAGGDLEGILGTFEPDGYAREPSGGAFVHRGVERLRTLYAHMFANGGGIPLEHCTITDDGVRCAVEYNCVRWGVTDLPPQAGVAVYERGRSGLLVAARIYDDIEPPSISDTSSK